MAGRDPTVCTRSTIKGGRVWTITPTPWKHGKTRSWPHKPKRCFPHNRITNPRGKTSNVPSIQSSPVQAWSIILQRKPCIVLENDGVRLTCLTYWHWRTGSIPPIRPPYSRTLFALFGQNRRQRGKPRLSIACRSLTPYRPRRSRIRHPHRNTPRTCPRLSHCRDLENRPPYSAIRSHSSFIARTLCRRTDPEVRTFSVAWMWWVFRTDAGLGLNRRSRTVGRQCNVVKICATVPTQRNAHRVFRLTFAIGEWRIEKVHTMRNGIINRSIDGVLINFVIFPVSGIPFQAARRRCMSF